MNRVPAPGLSSKKSEITRPLLLQLVNIVLPHSRDVEEFITFYYEDVAKRCSSRMDRSDRLLQLFTAEAENLAGVLQNLILFQPDSQYIFEQLLCGEKPQVIQRSQALQRRRSNHNRLRQLTGYADSHLLCDRDREWKFIEAFTNRTDPRHELACLLGAVGEAHDEFCDRVQRHLPREGNLPREILRIEWESGPFPDTQAEFLFCLAARFGGTVDRLPEILGKRLAMTNLVILHPCIQGHYEDPSLWDFYLQWWPLLLSKIDTPGGGIKAIQPLEWPRSSLLVRTLVKFLMTLSPSRWHRKLAGLIEELAAQRAVQGLHKAHHPVLPISYLHPPLQPITDAQLYEFSNLISSEQAVRSEFVKQVRRRGASSAELLHAIAGQLPRKRAASDPKTGDKQRPLHG